MKNWDYLSDLAVRYHVDLREIRREVDEIPDKKTMNSYGPLVYQEYLYALCRILRPTIVVETGTRYGVGSSMILRALNRNEHGELYSCDPMHRSQADAEDGMRMHGFCDFERFTFIPGTSDVAFARLDDENVDEWDLFVHDSDHSKANMAFELSYSLSRLKEHGVIVCDDWDWPDPYLPDGGYHDAANEFCRAHGFEHHRIESAGVIEL